ncbi:protein lifeguard 3 isoform X7 [Drosophila teissieri]|nr:protein lifeguard 3 isoform X7 [Drosophila teissieri]
MDLPKEETGFPDKVSLYALFNFLPLPGNSEPYPPISLPAPPTENESQATNSAPKDGKHLIENGIITQDLIIKSNVFEDPTIRMGFVRKVFGILLVQLLFTLVVIAIFAYHQPTKDFMQDNFLLVLVAMIVNIMVLTTIVCVENVRRKHPVNLICLALYTFTMSLLLGTASSLMDSNVVISAVAITTVLVIALCIYAVQTNVWFLDARLRRQLANNLPMHFYWLFFFNLRYAVDSGRQSFGTVGSRGICVCSSHS